MGRPVHRVFCLVCCSPLSEDGSSLAASHDVTMATHLKFLRVTTDGATIGSKNSRSTNRPPLWTFGEEQLRFSKFPQPLRISRHRSTFRRLRMSRHPIKTPIMNDPHHVQRPGALWCGGVRRSEERGSCLYATRSVTAPGKERLPPHREAVRVLTHLLILIRTLFDFGIRVVFGHSW